MESPTVLEAAEAVAKAAAWQALAAATREAYESGEVLRQLLADWQTCLADEAAAAHAIGRVRTATAALRACYRLSVGEELAG